MTDPAPHLGRLVPVDPRAVWQHEASHFTPWLRDHADQLGEALGIDIELTEAERPVGGYSLDLLGRDLTNDAVLIVENQLEGTDHTHLGQVLTYAAGTDAQTIVWLATTFREEHRQALDWLNEHTGEDVHFFGVQLGVVRIGDSAPAPLFDLVVEPNDWQKRVRAATQSARAGGKADYYLRFWKRYLDRVHDEHPSWTRTRRAVTQNWIDMPGPIRGTVINPSFAARGRLRHEIYIDTGDAEQNSLIFEALLDQRAVLEEAYGASLVFEELPGRRASRVAEYREGDVTQDESHEEFVEWFIDAGVRLRAALSTVVWPEFG